MSRNSSLMCSEIYLDPAPLTAEESQRLTLVASVPGWDVANLALGPR